MFLQCTFYVVPFLPSVNIELQEILIEDDARSQQKKKNSNMIAVTVLSSDLLTLRKYSPLETALFVMSFNLMSSPSYTRLMSGIRSIREPC